MNYWIYLIICWITKPFRWLMPFWKNSDFEFAVRLLFWNNYKNNFIWTQVCHETGHFTSNLYKNHHNMVGMAWIEGKYQYKKYESPLAGEPHNRASYRSVYQGVYDLYDYYYGRVKSSGKALDKIPQSAWDSSAPVSQPYYYQMATALKNNGFFTASLVGYYNALQANGVYYKANIWRFIVNLVYAVSVPSVIAWLYRSGRIRFKKFW